MSFISEPHPEKGDAFHTLSIKWYLQWQTPCCCWPSIGRLMISGKYKLKTWLEMMLGLWSLLEERVFHAVILLVWSSSLPLTLTYTHTQRQQTQVHISVLTGQSCQYGLNTSLQVFSFIAAYLCDWLRRLNEGLGLLNYSNNHSTASATQRILHWTLFVRLRFLCLMYQRMCFNVKYDNLYLKLYIKLGLGNDSNF